MSIGEDEFGLPPRCKTCGDTTASDGVCVECKPYVEYVCLRCLRGKPKPVEQEPPAVPPIDPDSMPSTEPPPMPGESLGPYKSTTSLYPGWTIDEHENGWGVFHCGPQRLISERKFLKSAGHTRRDAVNYAASEHAKHNGGS